MIKLFLYLFEKKTTNKYVYLTSSQCFLSSGRGVFAKEYIEPKSFVVEYRGVLSSDGAEDKDCKYSFDFIWNGKHHW